MFIIEEKSKKCLLDKGFVPLNGTVNILDTRDLTVESYTVKQASDIMKQVPLYNAVRNRQRRLGYAPQDLSKIPELQLNIAMCEANGFPAYRVLFRGIEVLRIYLGSPNLIQFMTFSSRGSKVVDLMQDKAVDMRDMVKGVSYIGWEHNKEYVLIELQLKVGVLQLQYGNGATMSLDLF